MFSRKKFGSRYYHFLIKAGFNVQREIHWQAVSIRVLCLLWRKRFFRSSCMHSAQITRGSNGPVLFPKILTMTSNSNRGCFLQKFEVSYTDPGEEKRWDFHLVLSILISFFHPCSSHLSFCSACLFLSFSCRSRENKINIWFMVNVCPSSYDCMPEDATHDCNR